MWTMDDELICTLTLEVAASACIFIMVTKNKHNRINDHFKRLLILTIFAINVER